MSIPVGILAIDAYLPEKVRTQNDWPKHLVERWTKRLRKLVPDRDCAAHTDGVKLALAAIEAMKDDPFQGAREVRVIADEDQSSDLEARAARQALDQAALAPEDIDLLLTHSMVPDVLCVNPAAIVHEKLGLRRDITAFGVEGVCASFLLQLSLAAKYIRAGEATRALVTQSSACTRLMPEDAPFSPWFGDAGTAAVVGEVAPGYGLLSMSQHTYGSLHRAFCANVPGGRWYDGGRVVACNEDRDASRRSQLEAPDMAKPVVLDALEKAGLRPEDVDFFACHQPTNWFLPVTKEHCRLVNAKTAPTFSWTGSLSSSNLPMQLTVATREKLLERGDVVVLFTVAGGMTLTAAVLRWY